MKVADFVIGAAHIGAGGRPGPPPVQAIADRWPEILDFAIEHRVAPLVAEALLQTPEGVPGSVRDAFWAQVLRSSATRLLCETTLAQVINLLRARGVEVIVLKGPTVAYDVYPRPELRIYHDLDLLCRVGDYAVLHEVLMANGYSDAGTSDARGSHEKLAVKPLATESQAVRGFYDPSGEMKLEVHFDALQLGLMDRSEESFWRNARAREVGGVRINELAPEHQFLHLALHAHRHCYSRLSWLIELDLIVRRRAASMDWALLNETARFEGVGAAVRHCFLTLHSVLDTPLPTLPAATLEEICLGLAYRALWPVAKTRSLNQHERHRLMHFLPDDADPRNVLYGLLLVGRRREKLHALLRRRWPAA